MGDVLPNNMCSLLVTLISEEIRDILLLRCKTSTKLSLS